MSSSSSSSATVGVDKATSDLLIGPDWTMNIDICDSINSHRWQAKDVVKALKKRLLHKNPKVQLLALTLLETMIKNCGDNVHFQIAEKNILQEMIKIVRKKTDMHVRDKILVLIDSWQEAFGGPGGKYPQYYWAYEELRRSGVEFPQRSRDAAPIFTPPVAHPMLRHSQAGYGMPSDTSRRLDEAMASEMENLSLSNLDSMQSVQELLADMLQAVNPNDREAIKDEVIVDLVSQCRSNQRKLMQMLTSTGDEELLAKGLVLNDSLQSLLAKHDAIASGSPLPTEVLGNSSPVPTEVIRNSSPVPTEVRDASPRSNATPIAASVTSSQLEEEEDEDDDFAQLARRRTKISTVPSESAPTGIGQGATQPSTSNPSNALVPTTPPTPVRTTTTKEQEMIDLLSITLSTTSTSPRTTPSSSNQNMHQVPVSASTEGYPYGQHYTENQGQVAYSSYVAPWAQPQVQPPQPQPWVQQQQPQSWNQPQLQQSWNQQQQQQSWNQQQQQPWNQPQQQQPWNQPQQQQSWTRPQQPQWAQPQQPWAQSQDQTQPWTQPQAQTHQPRAQPQQPQAQPQQSQQPWSQPQLQSQPQPWTQPQAQPQQPQAQSQQLEAQPWSQQQPQSELQSQPEPQPQAQESQTQPQSQPQSQSQPLQPQARPEQPEAQAWAQPEAQSEPQTQPQPQLQPQPQVTQQSFRYPPPPWATAPANSHQNPLSTTPTAYDIWTSHANPSAASYNPMHAAKPLQSHNSFPARVNNGKAVMYGEAQGVSSPQRHMSLSAGQKPFVPSYRLFEDLNVLGSADAASSNSPRMSGQSMLGGRK